MVNEGTISFENGFKYPKTEKDILSKINLNFADLK